MIEVMQLGEVRVPLGQAPVLDAAVDGTKDAADFVAELGPLGEDLAPLVDDNAIEGAQVVPDGGGLMLVTPIAAFPDLRIPVEPVPDAGAGAVSVPGVAGLVGFGPAAGVSPPSIAPALAAVDVPRVADKTTDAAAKTMPEPDIGVAQGPAQGPVPIRTALVGVVQRPDLILTENTVTLQERKVPVLAPRPEPAITPPGAPDLVAGINVPRPVAATKAETRPAMAAVSASPASAVDAATMLGPDAAPVDAVLVVPATAFPLSRHMATEFRWSESVRVAQPVLAAPTVPGPGIGPAMPLGGAVSDAAVLVGPVFAGEGVPIGPAVDGARPDPGEIHSAKAEPGSEYPKAVVVKEPILPGGDGLRVDGGDALRRDPPPDLTLPSLSPLPDPQQPLPPAPRDAPMRIGPEGVTQQVAHLILSHAEDRAELLLDPAELGRLRFEITQRGEGVQIVVMAERPETMDLLRRHADQLLDDLQAMGFSGSALGFGNWNGPPQQFQPPLPEAERVQTPFAVAVPFPTPPPPRDAVGGLDLRL